MVISVINKYLCIIASDLTELFYVIFFYVVECKCSKSKTDIDLQDLIFYV